MTALHVVAQAAADLALLPVIIPDPAPLQPPGTDGVTTLLAWLKWICLAVAGAAIIIGGAVIAFNSRRGEGQEAVGKVAWPMAGVIVIAGGISMVSFIATA